MENTCRSCGGMLERVGNYNLCRFCGNKWVIDVGDDIRAVDRANAWSALRDGDFERATELFENIILKERNNHEAYWGRALSLNGIIYVNDMNERKKVPTCNSISEDSFIEDRDVKNAIAYAPDEIAETYKKQAEQIEKIRVEWLEKARREPPYDVFISFKDSDREKGIERTQDSIDAQDLYNGLVAEGFKVFFSRISLRNKVSEQYEPYIYNAIKTAKVMVVFGENPEYFSAVWIKNEWSRFKNRIENGEKHKNSLVVAYKDMNPADLPVVLKTRQCLNAGEMTFLPDLVRHIKRVIAESKQDEHLDRVEIKGGQISKKASKIANESIETREIGAGAVAETDISEKQQLDLAKAYMYNKEWEDAGKLIDDLLFSNPTYAEAIWFGLMNKHKVTSDLSLLKRFPYFDESDFASVEKVLNCADKDFAASKLDMLYLSDGDLDTTTYLKIIDIILPYNYENREERIEEIFKHATLNDDYRLFKKMLSTLQSEDVDDYIEYNMQYAGLTKNKSYELECVNAVLSVDEGNIAALKQKMDLVWDTAQKAELVALLEKILMYSASPNDEIISFLIDIAPSVSNTVHFEVVKEAMRFYSGELSAIKNTLINLAYSILDNLLFDEAGFLFNLALSADPQNTKIYWGICLVKTRSKSEKDIVNSDISIKSVPEYTKYLTMVDDKRRQECMSIAKRQTARQESKREKRKAAIISAIVISTIVLIVIAAVILTVFVMPAIRRSNDYDEALTLMNDGKYAEAIVIFEELDDYKDSADKIIACETAIKDIAYNKAADLMSKGKYADAIEAFKALNGYKDSADKITACETGIKDIAYENAIALMNDGKYSEAIEAFEALNGYKDSADKITACETGIKDIAYENAVALMNDGKYSEAIEAFEALNGYKDSADKIIACETAINDIAYENAVALMNDGKYSEAIEAFEALNGYKDIADKITACENAIKDIEYEKAIALMNDGKYSEAIEAFQALNGYKDSISRIADCEKANKNPAYDNAVALMNDGKYSEAIEVLEAIDNYKDSADLLNKCQVYLNLNYSLIDNKYYSVKGFSRSTTDDTTVVIPSMYNGFPVIGIGDKAFYECSSITSITIPEGVTSIGNRAFSYCDSLTSIAIPDSVTSIGDYAFYYCSSLTSITIPDSVTSIGDDAFLLCESLTSITIPNSVTRIGDGAFCKCPSLESVYIGDAVTSIGISVFVDSFSLESITVDENNKVYHSADNCLIETASKTLIAGCKNSVIPADGSVTSIGDNAFYGHSSLTSITIPDSVTSIGDWAFGFCYSLTSITIPEGVTSIGDSAFGGCPKLVEVINKSSLDITVWSLGFDAVIEVHSGTTKIVNQNGYLFYSYNGVNYLLGYVGNDTDLFLPEKHNGESYEIYQDTFRGSSSLTSITIPEGVTSIGDSAFDNCSSMTSITIPDSVTSIGDYAFSWCSSLKTVYYTGTEEEWAAISIGVDNDELETATIIYNYVPEE